ncbi:alpha-L-rhamnosidase C-terminal domain-containing protein [Enterococcus casseliflavus]|nr:alpha-L-rhamnosidase C-terminal domain-containing protein [Enterococcus casseliflavus]
MFRKLCGIDSLKPGYKQILIKSELGGGFISAKRSYVSEYGKISVEWMLKDSRFNLKVEVPCNTSAKIVLPSGITHLVGSGKYEFSNVII